MNLTRRVSGRTHIQESVLVCSGVWEFDKSSPLFTTFHNIVFWCDSGGTDNPRKNHGELFRAILRFAEHLWENHGGTTENPFGDHTIFAILFCKDCELK